MEYKKYKTTGGVGTNTAFRRQLMRNILCGNVTVERLAELRYFNNEMVKVIKDYNECVGSESVEYTNQESGKVSTDFFIRPGVRFSSFELGGSSISNSNASNFENKTVIRIGIQAKFNLPGKNERWAITIEPTYQSFQSDGELIFGNDVDKSTEIDYKSIELPIGIQHHFLLSNTSVLFVNIGYALDFPIGDSFIKTKKTFEIQSAPNLSIGIGYAFKDLFSFEVRKGVKRDLLTDTIIENGYNYYSFIVGYRIF